MSRRVAIVQARMGSTRLPGKVLRPLMGRPMLHRVVERLKRCRHLDDVVVATSDRPADAAVALAAREAGASVFIGDEADVLGRYLGAARHFGANLVARVTADCPLIDPGIVDSALVLMQDQPEHVDYVSNCMARTFPRGLDVEVVPFGVLEHLDRLSTSPEEREHVTLRIYRHRSDYRIADLRNDEDLSGHYWTVDTLADFLFVARVYAELLPEKPTFDWRDILALVRAKPELEEINRDHVASSEQKHRALEQG